MAGFQIDMSPLNRSSMNIGQSLVNIGQTVGGAIQRSRQQELEQQQQQQQQLEQGNIEAFMHQALSGDQVALDELAIKSPQAYQQVTQHLQQQQATVQAGDELQAGERLAANQETIKKLYRVQALPEAEKEAAYKEILDSPFDDFDESDLPYINDPKNLNVWAVESFGADDAKAMFGGIGGEFIVQSSKILEDGSVVAISKGGDRQVTSPTGEIITGEAAKEVVKNSNKLSHQRKVELKKLDQTIKKAQLDDSLLNDQQKGIQRSNIQRLSTLSNTSSGRESAIKKATKFKDALSSGSALSGAGRKAATFVPGVFTSQGQFDEEFNAFSEVAARQQLKASGEIRPTDADVQGMKQAMFGIGRDEEVNVQLLSDFISDQLKQNEELDQLIAAGKSGDLSKFTYLPGSTVKAEETPVTQTEATEEQKATQKGGEVMEDASGNRAIVYPDGTFEELP